MESENEVLVENENEELTENEVVTETEEPTSEPVQIDGPVIHPVYANKHIVLADGTSYPGQAATDTEGDLWVWVDYGEGRTMVDLFPVFSNPDKTRRIESWVMDTQEPLVFEGYETMKIIREDGHTQTYIKLTK